MKGAPNPKDLVGARKAPLSLVPSALVIGAAEAAQNGADKYGPFNWREHPVQVMTYVEAMQRHLAAFVDGQDVAEDTGIHHLKHVAAGLGILLDSIGLGIAIDNRPPKGPAADLLRAQDKTMSPEEVSLEQFIAETRALANLAAVKSAVEKDAVPPCHLVETGLHDETCPEGRVIMAENAALNEASNARDAAVLWAAERRHERLLWGDRDEDRPIDYASGHGY